MKVRILSTQNGIVCIRSLQSRKNSVPIGEMGDIEKRNKFHNRKLDYNIKITKKAVQQAADAELLLNEEAGYLDVDDGTTNEVTQSEIVAAVDITSATKHFNLDLKFGPYKMDYTKNGRCLVIGGKKGHVAAIDWITKKLLCEINVMESVHDVQWLSLNTAFATAQKNHVYIYDNQGIELHCIKQMYRVQVMEYLPYHFLLATASDNGHLCWLDTSIGKMIGSFNAKVGQFNIMCQNPYNATLVTGHPNGTVAMWSPNEQKPLASMLCHNRPLRGMDIDHTGNYMATLAGLSMHIWDVRMMKQLHSYRLNSGGSRLAFSQTGQLAVSIGNTVEIYKDALKKSVEAPYLRHSCRNTITDMKFCPFEDVLGASNDYGFTSVIVPGSGEPNFDAFESNPFMTKMQRRELEVKSLLEKVQPALICLDPTKLGEVDVDTLKKKMKTKEELIHVKPPKIEINLNYKTKGKSGSGKKFKRKKIVKGQIIQKYVKEKLQEKQHQPKPKSSNVQKDVMDRFKKKS
ncbi:WD repeat-containing protein 46 [Nymphon striatum]|nr:WD repeat-containing protein 46 [Nymphon striatum]